MNTGLLPTKGLTLPLISYGGSSLIISLASLFMVARVDIENKRLLAAATAENHELELNDFRQLDMEQERGESL